jgi:hypothetical protein
MKQTLNGATLVAAGVVVAMVLLVGLTVAGLAGACW